MVISIGVHKPEQFQGVRPDTFFGRRRGFALDLLAEIERTGDSRIKRAFIESITDGAGVYKRTYSGRFLAFDQHILDCMSELQFSQPLRFLDAAVSDGSTSVEFFNGIAAHLAADFHFIATDRDSGFLVLNRNGSLDRRVIISAEGEIVQVVWPPFVFSGKRKDKLLLFPINRIGHPFAMQYARNLLKGWKENEPDLEARELVFACKAFRELLAEDSRMEFKAWDIATPWTGERVHCVRAMNILNPSYFSGRQLRSIVENLTASLIDGGLLAIGSNNGPGSQVDGAIYRIDGSRLLELKSSGAGVRCRQAIQSMLASSKGS